MNSSDSTRSDPIGRDPGSGADRAWRWSRVFLRLVPLALLAVFLWRARPWEADLPAVKAWPIALAVALNFGLYIPAKALRWREALPDPPPFLHIVAAMLEGFLANIALGLGAGDVVRSARLRNARATFAPDLGASIAERVTEYAVLGMLLVATAAIGATSAVGGILGGSFVAAFLVVVASRGRLLAHVQGTGRLRDAARAALAALRPYPVARMAAWSLAGWTVELAMLILTLHALGLTPNPGTAVLVLVGVNAAIAIPGPPANLGTFEVGAVAALVWRGVGVQTALAFALLYHMLHVIPVTIVATTVYLARGGRVSGH